MPLCPRFLKLLCRPRYECERLPYQCWGWYEYVTHPNLLLVQSECEQKPLKSCPIPSVSGYRSMMSCPTHSEYD